MLRVGLKSVELRYADIYDTNVSVPIFYYIITLNQLPVSLRMRNGRIIVNGALETILWTRSWVYVTL
jgi:hypothetical protein